KEEAEWVEIRKLKTVYEQALSNNQLDQLEPYLAKNFRGVVFTGEELKSFAEVKTYHGKIRELIGAGGTYQVKVNHAPGTMLGDVAIAHGDTDEQVTTGGGKKYSFKTLWTVNLVKEAGSWKIFRLQASLDPLDNVFVQDTVRMVQLTFGIGGALGGALLAAVILKLKK
ncbi:MAG: YybH family protein, partial [Bryobacteraceae bacterium]